ncbi:hypothetical protein ACN2XU_14730 [Primorskyibacter sp. 2E107]|uniref:hypothetical protein n=1 Tax=Primorskyibacter sp. 2E107 TaxID=3403458 RepID=UPI003AF8449E
MAFLALPEGALNWNGGKRITLRAGETATCTTLNPGQLYAVFVYNSAQHDTNATLFVNWSNKEPPKQVTIPGTTANAGLASLAFVSGSDTQTVSVSMPSNSGMAQVEIWLGSVSMPTDTTGLTNEQLPADGAQHEFNKYRRYWSVPASSWHQLTIVSTITQFISVQFTSSKAVVYVVGETPNGLLDGQVVSVGAAAEPGVVTPHLTSSRSVMNTISGGGFQYVWMNADSEQDSSEATISLQSI